MCGKRLKLRPIVVALAVLVTVAVVDGLLMGWFLVNLVLQLQNLSLG